MSTDTEILKSEIQAWERKGIQLISERNEARALARVYRKRIYRLEEELNIVLGAVLEMDWDEIPACNWKIFTEDKRDFPALWVTGCGEDYYGDWLLGEVKFCPYCGGMIDEEQDGHI